MTLSAADSRRVRRGLRALEVAPDILFSPSPKQRQFLESQHKRVLLRAANQVGKTTIGAKKVVDYMRANPGSTVLVLAADHTAKIEVVGVALAEFATPADLDVTSDFNTARGWRNDQMLFENGSRAIFRSAQSQTTSIAGLSVDAAWVDEPPTQKTWGEVTTRVAVAHNPDGPGGELWLTFTPVGREVGWLRKLVEGDPTTNPPTPPSEDWEQIVIQLTARDCPHRSQKSIDAQTAAYGPWEYAARVLGAWEGETEDRAFDGFTEECVVDTVPTAAYSVGLGMDHGQLAGAETAVLVLWSSSAKRIYVVDEYASQTATDIEQDSAAIREMLSRHRLQPESVDLAFGDVNAAGKTRPGVKVNQLFEEALPGLRIRRPRKDRGSLDYGVRVMNVALKRGHLRVHSRCAGLERSLRHWKRGDEGLKHMLDALRYVVVPILEDMYDSTEIDRLRLRRA